MLIGEPTDAPRTPVNPRWAPPYGWPDAPIDWAPHAEWQPPAGLLLPPGHTWWVADDINPDDETRTEIQHGLMVEREPYYRLEARIKNLPTVWTPPPTWPIAPAGFEPSIGWTAPKAWGPAPPDWNFQQPTPERLEQERAWVAERDADAHAILTTPAGLLAVLNDLERRLALAGVLRAQLTPTALHIAKRQVLSIKRKHRALLDERLAAVTAAAGTLRHHTLWHLRTATKPEPTHQKLRRALLDTHLPLLQAHLDARIPHHEAAAREWIRNDFEDGPTRRYLDASWDVISAHINSLHLPDSEDTEDSNLASVPHSSTHRDNTPAWAQAEEQATHWLRNNGYPDAHRTPTGADAGFDVEARGLVAQVKHRTHPTGRDDIQRLAGANLHQAHMTFFSTSGYTNPALQFARAAGIVTYQLDMTTGIVTSIP